MKIGPNCGEPIGHDLKLKISGDFGVIERPVFLASSANTCTYGGAIPIAPGATPGPP